MRAAGLRAEDDTLSQKSKNFAISCYHSLHGILRPVRQRAIMQEQLSYYAKAEDHSLVIC
jgi:hypothetical protein